MRTKFRFVLGAGLIVAAVAYLIVAAVQSTAEYYLTVNQVNARGTKLVGQNLRVGGSVKPGTVSWDPKTLTLKFAIVQPHSPGKAVVPAKTAVTRVAQSNTGNAAADPDPAPSFFVTCVGEPKPDMFAPGRDVIVQGRLESGGRIEATQVLTKCPSKYQALRKGS